MRAKVAVAGWIMACVLSATALADSSSMQIGFAEAVRIPASAGKAEFDAYGRRFSLMLEANDRVMRALPAAQKSQLGEVRALRGKVDGVPGSWVRLTRVGSTLQGAIWDGNEMYVVAPYHSIAANLTTPLPVAPDQTVVYRLSDTLDGLPPEFCGVVDNLPQSKATDSGLVQFKTIVSGLRANAATLEDSLDIALIADRLFQESAGGAAMERMIARLNVVDGIFAEQVGVVILPSEIHLVPSNADPFNTSDASKLLDQLSGYRLNTPAIRAAGLAHLMTGRTLNGDTVGIAYVDSLCHENDGVSISSSVGSDFWSALVMAHELGHNFGARHDGVSGVCAATPQNYLMSPWVNGSSQFSACSLNSMAASIATARGVCIGPANYVDIAVSLPPSPYTVQTNGTFSLPITVRSFGNLAATEVELRVEFAPWFGLAGATVVDTNCTVNDRLVTCQLGDMAAGEERALDMQVSGISIGNFPLKAEVTTTANEYITGNNTSNIQIGVQSGVDVGITVDVSATEIFVTDPLDVDVDLASLGTLSSIGGTVWINLGGIPIESFDDGPHTCAIDQFSPWDLSCQLADMPAGTTTHISVRGRAVRPSNSSTVNVSANVPNDSNWANNQRISNLVVKSEREVRTSVSAEELRAVIGDSYQLTYTLTTLGRLPSENVRFSLQQPPLGVVDSVNAGGAPCVADPDFTHCELGTLNPGDTRIVTVTFHMTAATTSFMSASARWTDGAIDAFSNAMTWVYANVTVDVEVWPHYAPAVDEGNTGESGFSLQSRGIDPAPNITATIEVTPPLRLTSITPGPSVAGWTCTILTPQTGSCTGSLGVTPYTSSTYVKFTYVSDVAVNGQATISVETPGDGDATNDDTQIAVIVLPYVDIGIEASTVPRLLVNGQTTTINATIRTGKNPVPNARLAAWSTDASVVLDSLAVEGVDCSLTSPGTPCALDTLPANASIAVSAVFRAAMGNSSPTVVFDVYPDYDSNYANNHVYIPVHTMDNVDISLTVARASVTVTNGTRMEFPPITVSNGATTTRDVVVTIPIPPFTTVDSISVSGMCSGTTTLECRLNAIPPNSSSKINLWLTTTSTGTFSSNVSLAALNDSTPGNNAAAVAFTVNAPSSGGGGGGGGGAVGGGSSGSKKGGGGSLEWLTLALLGAFLWRRERARQSSAAIKARAARGFRSFAPLMK